MEFRKMVMITLYAKQKKRQQMYRTEFWTLGEGEGGMFLENSIETYIIYGETDHQPRLDT